MLEQAVLKLVLEHIFSQPGYLLRRAHQLSTAAFVQEAGELDLTPVQFLALLAISAQPETDAASVSEIISFDRTTTGHVLTRLEEKGLIRRALGQPDRRRKALTLTSSGHEVLGRALQITPSISERIVTSLSQEERATLTFLLRKIILGADAKPLGRESDV